MALPLNKNNSAVKRILQEARELANDTSTEYSAAPLEDDIFEWHCTLRGPAGTDYEGGLYHFRIKLPAEYPFRPPAIQMLTPSGRFELNTNICISFTNYHEESWQPAWGVRTAIIGLQGFFPLNGKDAIGVGGIEYPSAERKRLAQMSRDWICSTCQKSNREMLSEVVSTTHAVMQEALSDAPRNETTEVVERQTPEKVREEQPDNIVLHTPSRSSVSQDAITSPTTALHTNTQPIPASNGVNVVHSSRSPLLLDTAIGFLLVLITAILCRRIL